MRYWLIVFLALSFSYSAYSIADADRSFDAESIEEYKEDREFNYETQSANINWWNGFYEWLVAAIQDLFDEEDAETIGKTVYIIIRILLWAMVLFAIGMLGYSLYTKGVFGIIGRKPHQVNILGDDLLIIQSDQDWDALIKEAIIDRKYNEAIRFMFLQILKALSDSKLIELDKSKSTRDYQSELSAEYTNQFSILSRYYQYAWFGGVEIDESHFNEMHSRFKDFKVLNHVD